MEVGTNTRALVTGASRGIGRALAGALARRGATVGLAARSEGELESLAAELPGAHQALPSDVGDRGSITAAIDRFAETAGGLDIVVANAGIAHYEKFTTAPLEKAEEMTRINWLGTLYTVHAALPHMLEQRSGHVVIISSGAALRSFPSAAVYGATKAAQRMFAEALRHDLADTGVSLTTVYPGEIATSLHDHEKAAMPPWYRGGPGAASADEMAEQVITAMEKDDRAVYFPRPVRLLRVLHGLSPRLSDVLLHRLRGSTAAPRTD